MCTVHNKKSETDGVYMLTRLRLKKPETDEAKLVELVTRSVRYTHTRTISQHSLHNDRSVKNIPFIGSCRSGLKKSNLE